MIHKEAGGKEIVSRSSTVPEQARRTVLLSSCLFVNKSSSKTRTILSGGQASSLTAGFFILSVMNGMNDDFLPLDWLKCCSRWRPSRILTYPIYPLHH
jgi:hypothetical protein